MVDVPTADTDLISEFVGVPALAVPQYWHLAAGLVEMFIAHTESRHRVKLAREQVVAAFAIGQASNTANIKNDSCLIIFSLAG